MSIGFWIGLVLILVGIIIGLIEYFTADNRTSISLITFFIGVPIIISGIVDTVVSVDKAKPGYILENSNGKQIEVLATKDNFIQFVQDSDTLIVTQHNWINKYCCDMEIVNIKNF